MNDIPKILVVDDEKDMRASMEEWLVEDGYEVRLAEGGEVALKYIKEEMFNAAFVDLKMPKMDGIQTMREVKKIDKDLPVIIITAYATVDTAVQAMKEGAYDYVVKPFNPQEITLMIKKIIEHQKLIKEVDFLRKELEKRYEFCDIIGKSEKMQEIFEFVKTVADSKSTILIQGETGTGKELIARAIHQMSPRKEGTFITLSCGVLAESLIESELFGYEKGAFTDAKFTKIGKLELAQGGTLFLDEIGDISLKIQVDLLRVLQEREFRRVGGTELIKIDTRIIAATNKDLKRGIKEGWFREDLFYRLNVINIILPPLKERKEDIPLLVNHFIKKVNIENKREVEKISSKALEKLLDYDWPGNVRELENVIERGCVVCKGRVIEISDLPPLFKEKDITSSSITPNISLEEIEKLHIINVLKAQNGNLLKSAEILGIERMTLYRKMEKYGIKRENESV